MFGRLEEEKKEIADQIRDVYAEAKGSGFLLTTIGGATVTSSFNKAPPTFHNISK